MKKIIVLVLVGVFFLIPNTSYAVSGACSWHGGVNCNVGPSISGGVICNDGWIDSSVMYSSMLGCGGSKCDLLIPKSTICNNESQYQEIYNEALQGTSKCVTGGEAGGFMTSSFTCLSPDQQIMNGAYAWQLKACRDEISSYNSQKALYDLCIADEDKKQDELLAQEMYNLAEKNKLIKDSDCLIKFGLGAFYYSPLNSCQCESGYEMNITKDKCITHDQGCKNDYGLHAFTQKDSDGYRCYCESGYSFDSNKQCAADNKSTSFISSSSVIKDLLNPVVQSAIQNNVVEREKEFESGYDKNFVAKVRGKIFLQVESVGEAWYINPKDEKKYYLKNGDEALKIMKSAGIGISNKDLDKMKKDKVFALKNKGKIFLQVEDFGQAFYVDFNGDLNYLENGQSAYEFMRKNGVGITNKDIRKISTK